MALNRWVAWVMPASKASFAWSYPAVVWAMDTVHSSRACPTNSMPPGSSGAMSTSFTIPPQAS